MNKTAAVADELVGQSGLRYQENVIFGKLVREKIVASDNRKRRKPEILKPCVYLQKARSHLHMFLITLVAQNKQCLYFSVLTCWKKDDKQSTLRKRNNVGSYLLRARLYWNSTYYFFFIAIFCIYFSQDDIQTCFIDNFLDVLSIIGYF